MASRTSNGASRARQRATATMTRCNPKTSSALDQSTRNAATPSSGCASRRAADQASRTAYPTRLTITACAGAAARSRSRPCRAHPTSTSSRAIAMNATPASTAEPPRSSSVTAAQPRPAITRSATPAVRADLRSHAVRAPARRRTWTSSRTGALVRVVVVRVPVAGLMGALSWNRPHGVCQGRPPKRPLPTPTRP